MIHPGTDPAETGAADQGNVHVSAGAQKAQTEAWESLKKGKF